MAGAEQQAYTARSIQLLTGLDPIRKRPGMYTDISSPDHLVQEVLDNSVDEALVGFAHEIQVALFEDGAIEVVDDGRGMPVDIHPEHKISGVELILTRLHAGGKFNDETYTYAGGLHGVGISVVNALSKRLEVSVRRDGQIYEMLFEEGLPKNSLTPVGKVGSKNTGTRICFWPNLTYFDTPTVSVSRLEHLLHAKAVLCPGLKLTLMMQKGSDWENKSWYYEDGLAGYLQKTLAGRPALLPELVCYQEVTDDVHVDWAMQWLPDAIPRDLVAESYVNLIPTPEGGTHVNGLRTGLLEALVEFCDFRSLLPKNIKLATEDLWSCCAYVLAIKMKEPQFRGQTKEKLASRQVSNWIAALARNSFSLWLNQHTEQAQQLAEMVIEAAQRRKQQARQVDRKKIVSSAATLPGKLADCSSRVVEETELFLVEGDSAGGSAKQARNRKNQAVLPLRGKIVNTWELDSDTVSQFQEIRHIAVALGVTPGNKELGGLRYGKICILADADSDGLHIATLLCALFFKHFHSLVTEGHLYVAVPPLYRINIGNDIHYAVDDKDKDSLIEQTSKKGRKSKISVQRFKGLGEMNPLQLRETAMAPQTRRLVQLTLDDSEKTQEEMDLLLAKKRAHDRRLWIEIGKP